MPPSDKKRAKRSATAAADAHQEEAPAVTSIKPKSSSRDLPTETAASESEDEMMAEMGEAETGAAETGGGDMNNMLSSFGANVEKTLSARRQRLSSFTSVALKTSSRKYEELYTAQQAERDALRSKFDAQLASVVAQCDGDAQKAKENNEKLEATIQHVQKSLQQQRVVQNQRIKSMKGLQENFIKGLRELSTSHQDQQVNINSVLKKDIQTLQKKMMDDTRKEEFANVRNSLQSMVFQV